MTRWKFDVPVGTDPDPRPMEALMTLAEEYERRREWEQCRRVLEEACEVRHGPAMYRLAKLLMNTPELPLSQQERFHRSEALLLHLEANSGKNMNPKLLLTMMELYAKMNRPMAALGCGLAAARLGNQPDSALLHNLERKLRDLPLEAVSEDLPGCRRLCEELSQVEGLSQRILSLLHQAAPLDPMAALEAGDLASHNARHEDADYFYSLAKDVYPNILRCTTPRPKKQPAIRPVKQTQKQKGGTFFYDILPKGTGRFFG